MSDPTRTAKPTHHVTVQPDKLEQLLFESGGTIVIPDGGGWATLINSRGSFTAWCETDLDVA